MQAFQAEGLVGDQIPSPADLETTLAAMRQRRASIVLRSSLVLVAVSFLLTLRGLVATLRHMAWWIAAGFLIMVAISLVSVIVVRAACEPREQSH